MNFDKISLKFVSKGSINNIPALMICAKPLSEPIMIRLPTHICVTRPQWVKSSFVLSSNFQLRHTPKRNPRSFADDVIKCILWAEAFRILIQITLNVIPRSAITNESSLFRLIQIQIIYAHHVYINIYSSLLSRKYTHHAKGRNKSFRIFGLQMWNTFVF